MSSEADFTLKLIDKFSGNAGKITGAMSEMTVRMRKAADGANELDVRLKSADSSAKHAGGSMAVAMGTLVAGALEFAAEKVFELGKGFVEAALSSADFAQRTIIGFQAVAKHGASAEKLFEHTRQLAEGLGLDVMDTNKQMVKLLAMQFNPKVATDLIKMGADMQALGADGESVSRILLQIGQIKAKGKLQGEELTVLAENGLSTQLVYEQLQKTLSKTKDQILKMQQAGKLTADMAIPAILAAVKAKTGESELGQRGAEVAQKTMSGMARKLRSEWQNMWIDVGREGTPAITEALKPLGDELHKLIKDPATKNALVDGIEAIGGVVRDAIPVIKSFVGGLVDGFQAAWPAIKSALDLLLGGFAKDSDWLTTAKDFGQVLGKITAGAIGVAGVVGGLLVGSLQLATMVVNILIGAWDGLINAVGKVVFTISDTVANLGAKWRNDALSAAADIVTGLVNGITAGTTLVAEAVAGLGGVALAAFKHVLGIASPSKVMEEMGGYTTQGFEIGLTARAGDIEQAGALTANAFANGLASVDGPVVGRAGGFDTGSVANSGGFGSATLNFEFNVQQREGQDARALAEDIASLVEDKVYSVFERFALEAGA